MHIDHLMDFLVVSKTMNLTLAADLRNTTQSNLSKRLRSLEKWIGHDLINRSNRPLSLTAYGEAFVPTAKAILEDLNSFRDDKIPWNQSEGGVLVATGISGIWSHTSGSGFASTVTPDYEGGRARVELSINHQISSGQSFTASTYYDGIGASGFESYGLGLGYEMQF